MSAAGNEDEDIVVFTDQEIKQIKDAFIGNRIQALILLDLGSSLRQGELLALKWSDISESYKDLKVQRSIKQVKIIAADGTSKYKTLIQTPKTKTSIRTVPIPSSLVAILENHKMLQQQDRKKAGFLYVESDFVFTTESGNNIDTRNLRGAYER